MKGADNMSSVKQKVTNEYRSYRKIYRKVIRKMLEIDGNGQPVVGSKGGVNGVWAALLRRNAAIEERCS
ncbi:hypothetical protein Nepgr_027767 [Nepenthes gracilis]|uniref:Uncharacterized protein n=1 Tax=Nepenthes gracilis TaxID=150966 RepID=A0AAD3TBI2_NEPGR|nr:hypothetical protein Nepgr_027767 [Nepenthes gracilis]